MTQIEVDKVDETLPYGATSEDILNLIDAIKVKYGNDRGIKQVYGKPNIENSRKTIKVIGISLDGLTFSDEGRKFAYETNNDEKQLILLKLLLKYPPYEYFLLNISNEKLAETSLEIIQSYWGKNTYGTSEHNRSNASITFAQLIELAGLGIFKLGRKGRPTRIEWNSNAEKFIRDIHKQVSLEANLVRDDYNQFKNQEASQVRIIHWSDDEPDYDSIKNKTPSRIDEQEEKLVKEVLEKSFSNEQQSKSLPQIDISVNIDMTDWDIDKIISFLKATQGIFEDNSKRE